MKIIAFKEPCCALLSPAMFVLLAVIVLCGADPARAQTTNTFPASGNAGIGTTSPAFSVDVEGSGANTSLRLKNLGTSGNDWLITTQNTSGGLGAGPLHFYDLTNQVTRMSIGNNGNVGIGMTVPATKLQLASGEIGIGQQGDTTPYLRLGIDWAYVQYLANNAYWTGSAYNYVNPGGYGGMASRIAQVSGVLQFDTASGGTNPITWSTRMTIGNNGNVGIGTASPLTTTHVAGGSSPYAGELGTFLITGGTSAKRFAFGVDSSATMYSWIQSVENGIVQRALALNPEGGNVGIGTTGAGQKLEVNGGALFVNNGSNASDIYLGSNVSTSSGRIEWDNNNAKLSLGMNGANKLTIDSSGNLTVTGNIAAKYQDVAEWVESSQTLSAGTVVVLDQSKSNQVVASSESYDTRVAGVISAKPGIALGESGESKVLVATTGRVRVKVDASAGAIHIGDLLVTSDKQGFAMKSEPVLIGKRQMHAPGTLIGKALEPLESGSGEILVLLSLQ